MAHVDLTGRRYGNLTVTRLSYRKETSLLNYWECKCDCGKSLVVRGAFLKSGLIQSCGCPVAGKEVPAPDNITVGQEVCFDPFINITGFASEDCRGNYVIGKVVYVNQLHQWFSVDFDGQRTSFKFCDVGDTVMLL